MKIRENYIKIKNILGLSMSLAKFEFKEKNEGNYLGITWYLLNPILMFFLLLLVFSDRLGNNIPNYPLYLLSGIIIFNFFQKTTIEATEIIKNNRWSIRSINFPKEALLGSIIFKIFFSHILEIILFTIFLTIFNAPLYGIAFYPLILLLLGFFVYGLSLILSVITIYFTDFKNVWIFASTLIWLGTPIFYGIENQTKLFYANLFNPLYYFITMARDLIIYLRMPELWVILGTVGFGLLFLILGTSIFNKLKFKFTEKI